MSLTILSSNRVEILQAALARRLLENPLPDPFASEVIVVPTFAMGRWLNLRFAMQQGVAANLHYPQPAAWLWQLAGTVLDDLPRRDPWTREALGWRVFSLLPEMVDSGAFRTLADYLDDDDDGIKHWQLSERIAASFDRYQSYRPELIRDWSRGKDSHWQAKLWRALAEEGGNTHRVAVLERLVEVLADSSQRGLPRRVSLFALSTLPPLYLETLRAMAPRMELHLYLHSPSDQYWADLETQKREARRRLEHCGEEDPYSAGNDLLASWGRQGQVFQDQLLSRVAAEAIDVEQFAPPDEDSLLGMLQASIFSLDPAPRPLPSDDSVSLHVCHGPMRECQVLLDQLFDMLERDPSLEPEDILVMIPDIAAYAPYIEAVFQRQPINFNISDITLADEHPLIVTFLQLLQLPSSRFTQQEVLALLENAALRRRFEIDEQALAEIHRLVDDGHTRWGMDAAHKADFGLPATKGNTWQQLHDRFFAGFSMAGDELWHDIAPLPAGDDAEAPALGRFWHLLGRLRGCRERLGRTRRAVEWQTLLMQALEDFFVEVDFRESRLQQIRDAIGSIGEAGNAYLSPALMVYLMRRQLQSSEHSGQLYSGGITFCGMRPMRSIPFRVICLLGMNRDDFPRRDPPSDFELLAANPSVSDPGRRTEDRYLMLETLLCARQKLYLSYTGRSMRDNSEWQPSVLIQELMDFIDAQFYLAEGSAPASHNLTRVHTMQVFSAAAYNAPDFSYREYWCDVAHKLDRDGPAPKLPWPTRALDSDSTDGNGDVDLERLRRFVTDPVQYFYRHRLGIYLAGEDTPDIDEPFSPSSLDTWYLRQRLAQDSLAGGGADIARLSAEGLLAHGAAAAVQIERIRQDAGEWLAAITEYSRVPRQPLSIDFEIEGGRRLAGSLLDYFPGRGLMAYHGGKLKGHRLLGLWVDHLALCAAGIAGEQESSLFIASDTRRRIPLLSSVEAHGLLSELCSLYFEGLRRPLPVFPEISYTWATHESRDKALEEALKKWHDPWNPGGDRKNRYLALALQTGYRLPFDEAEFDRCAHILYSRLLAEAIEE